MTSFRDDIYPFAWWFSIITLPMMIPLTSISVILLGLVWLLDTKLDEKWRRLKTAPWILPFLIFFMLHLVGLCYTEHIRDGWSEVEKKLGFLVLPIIAASGRPLTKTAFDFVQRGFIYSCLLIVVTSLVLTAFNLSNDTAGPLQNFDPVTLQQFHLFNPGSSTHWEYFSYIQLGSWIDIHPSYFSMYLIFCIIILGQDMFDRNKTDFFSLSVILLFTFFVAMLASRIAIASYLVVTLCMAYQNYGRAGNRKGILVAGLMVFTLGTLVWVNPVARFRVIQEPAFTAFHIDESQTVWNSTSLRLLEWKASRHVIEKSPIVGVSPGDGQAAMQSFYESYNSSTRGLTYNAHNQYLQTTLELGLVGLLVLLVCIFKPLARSIDYQPAHLTLVILFGLMCITESMLARQKGILFFTMFQSLYFSFNRS